MSKDDVTPCKHGVDVDVEKCRDCLVEQYGEEVADDIIERG